MPMFSTTGKHNGRQIFTSVALVPIESLNGIGANLSEMAPKVHVLNALIDTGATTTSVSAKAANDLNLYPSGMHKVMTAGGIQIRPAYHLRVGFAKILDSSQELLIPDRPIAATEMSNQNLPFDVLLGMDIITQGQLLVTPTRYEFKCNSLL